MAKTTISKKEARKKVLKTQIGKTTNNCIFLFFAAFITSIVVTVILDFKLQETYEKIYPLIEILKWGVFAAGCYFVGKLEGLIVSHRNK